MCQPGLWGTVEGARGRFGDLSPVRRRGGPDVIDGGQRGQTAGTRARGGQEGGD